MADSSEAPITTTTEESSDPSLQINPNDSFVDASSMPATAFESQAMPIPASSQPDTQTETQTETQEEDDLFGSDDEAADAAAAEPVDEGRGVEDDDLFGDGDEEEFPPVGGDQQDSAGGVQDEDLFGEDADEVPEEDDRAPKQTKIVTVADGVNIHRDRRRNVLKLPNVLSADFNPFDEESYNPSSKIAFREVMDMEQHRFVQLENAENYIRWRYKKDKKGKIVYDENGRPLMESNARLVEWEDGTSSIFVGKEPFRVSSRPESIQLFEDRSKNVKVFQSMINEQLTVMPLGLGSETHKRLKNSQINKVKPNRKVQLQLHGPEAERKRLLALGITEEEEVGGVARPKKIAGRSDKTTGHHQAVGNIAMQAIGYLNAQAGGAPPGEEDAQPKLVKRSAEDQEVYEEEHGVSLQDVKRRR